jgi:hypothetical protein
MATADLHALPAKFRDYHWAINIVQRRFARGLERFCSPQFVEERHRDFIAERDPILFPLVTGMQDQALQRVYVSFYSIYHTIATQTRFWLESAIADILIHQIRVFGRSVTHLFTQNMLADSGGFDGSKTVANIGDEELEHVAGKKEWRVDLKEAVISKAAELVSSYDRKYDQGSVKQEAADRSRLDPVDRDEMAEIIRSVKGEATASHKLYCDLLVVGPDQLDGKVGVRAFRFINPKTFSKRAERKSERENLLRLLGYLVQEKILRTPETIKVQIAEIVPRPSPSSKGILGFPYFTQHSYWVAEQFWSQYIGVPFEVVEWAIRDIGQRVLADRLRDLLPGHRAFADQSFE